MVSNIATILTARSFPNTATEAAFLLGGIGTGNVSISSRGDLRDWEIFNRPAKGLKIPYSFFAICCRDRRRRQRVLPASSKDLCRPRTPGPTASILGLLPACPTCRRPS